MLPWDPMLPWDWPMLPWLCDWVPMLADGSEGLAPVAEPAPVCAIANAVLKAVANTRVFKYFVMRVSPRLVDRFWILELPTSELVDKVAKLAQARPDQTCCTGNCTWCATHARNGRAALEFGGDCNLHKELELRGYLADPGDGWDWVCHGILRLRT